MKSNSEIFVSVDVETSGPIPGEFSLLSIGACDVYDFKKTFSIELKPLSLNADPKAIEVSGLSLEVLQKTGVDPREALQRFNNWLGSLGGVDDILIFVGFNAPFDWSFVNYYFHRFGVGNPFGFTAIDIKAFYMGKTDCSWNDTRSSKIAEHVHPSLRGNHNALQDALYQAELFRLIRNLE